MGRLARFKQKEDMKVLRGRERLHDRINNYCAMFVSCSTIKQGDMTAKFNPEILSHRLE
jgi:hypothetical protein